jgi:outer membrane protein OmpA-like peptidoglycan-associated protein
MVQRILKQENSIVKKLINHLLSIMMVVVLAGCSSLRQAELASGNDLEKAIAEVAQIMLAAQQDQIDALAHDEYTKGTVYLEDAKRGLKQGDKPETVLKNAAIAKALFEDARVTASSRKPLASRILTSRASALSAGVRNSDDLVERLLEIDHDLRRKTKQFSRSLSPEDFSAFQKKYLALEVKAVQFRELNGAKQAIAQAKDQNAKKLAPETLQTASLDYETAMNMIDQSPRSSALYKKSVDTALASATLLVDVMNVIMGAKGTPEHIALQIVKQKRALGEAQLTLQEKEGVLKKQEEQLARASTQVRFQQAMDEARKEISPDDALVYQQGNQLVFRLKRMNFPSGAAVIPETSKLLLAKVEAIIKKLDAEKVVVQGHTDSVGSDKVNQRLSTERAKAVASYLHSVGGGYKIQYIGYGESHPIASNETSAGRATNRRVDLVVSVKQ